MTTAEFAKEVGISRVRVQALVREGKIPAVKLGRDWHIEKIELDKWEVIRVNSRCFLIPRR